MTLGDSFTSCTQEFRTLESPSLRGGGEVLATTDWTVFDLLRVYCWTCESARTAVITGTSDWVGHVMTSSSKKQ